jgi:hypothetical protein
MSRITEQFTTTWSETTRSLTINPTTSDRIVIPTSDLRIVPVKDSTLLVKIDNANIVDWSKDTSLGATSRDDFISKVSALVVQPTITTENAFLEATFNSSTNYSREVLLGNITGLSTTELTYGNITNWTKLSSAETMEVASSSASDTLAGTGARAIFVIGIGSDGASASETVLMNGTTDVTTTNSYLFINRVYVVSAGSNEANLGNITLTATTAGTVQGYVRAEISISEELRYMVPSDRSGTWVYNVYETDKSSGQERIMTVRAYTYPGTIPSVRILAAQTKQSSDLNNLVITRPFGGLLDPGTIIYWTAESNGTGTTGRATIGLFFEITSS